jgi:uncharacterized membrane protein YwaF
MDAVFAWMFVIFAILAFVFWLWMLVDCATKESDQGNNKVVWVLIILFANLPGAAAHFLVRRPRRFTKSLPFQFKGA